MKKSLKRALSILLAMIMTIGIAPLSGFAEADTYTYTDGIYEYTIKNGEATIVCCNDPSGDIIIPETLGGYPVVCIDGFQPLEFVENHSLTSIVFPSTLRTIGDYAFSNNYWALKSIKLNDGLKVIERCAFEGCKSIEEIVIPDTVKCISDGAFSDCENLRTVDLGNSEYLAMDYDVFHSCKSLERFTVGEACVNYCTDEYGVLYGNDKYCLLVYPPNAPMKEYSVDENVAFIADCAFEYCRNLEKVILPDELITIGDYSFRGSSKLESITIPDNVEFINANAFSQCESLRIVDLGNSENLMLDYEIFAGSTSIERITIGEKNKYYCTDENGVLYTKDKTAIVRYPAASQMTEYTVDKNTIYINDFSFENSLNLEKITLPENLMSIGLYAFRYSENIADVYYYGSEDDWAKIDFSYGNSNLTNATIHFVDKEKVASGQCGEEVYWTLYEDGELVITGTGAMDDYDYLDDFYTPWDFYADLIEKVIIENGVTNVGDWAFYYCENLSKVEIADSVTIIGARAFDYCENLKTVTIPDNVTVIGDYAFTACTSLTTVEMSDNVSSIGEGAFSHCSSLSDITIPDKVEFIGDYAFFYCDSIDSVIIPDSVTSIGAYAFSCCICLESFVVDENNAYYSSDSEGVLYNKDKTTIVTYPCGKFGDYSVPDGVTDIGDCAFVFCEGLTSIVLPDSVTNIGIAAFQYCTALQEITISSEAENIGDYAFCECYCLTDVYYNGTETEWNEITIGEENEYLTDAVIHFLVEEDIRTVLASGSCGEEVNWTLYEDGELEIIGTGDMENYDIYEEVLAPWFEYAELIKSVNVSNGITNIGDCAFLYCVNLSEIIIPESITNIGFGAFAYCTALTDIDIPDGVENIGDSAFMDCEELTSIVIPDGITSINDNVFMLCIGLTSVTIPDTVESIGAWSFYGCASLTEIVIPDSVKTLGSCSFAYCSGLISVIIPDSVTSMGSNSFGCCYGLTEITIGSGITSIGEWEFSLCESLEKITFTKNITSIGECAFADCENLTDVYFIGTEEDWNKIEIGEENEPLLNATIHFSEVEDKFELSNLQPLRGTVAMETIDGENVIVLTKADGRTMVGFYKDLLDGSTAELVSTHGKIQDRDKDYVAYASENIINPSAKLKVNFTDGTTETYTVIFRILDNTDDTASPYGCDSSTLTLVEGYDATCGGNGRVTHYKCVCGKLYLDAEATNETTEKAIVIKADTEGHVFGDWKVTTEPTLTENGEKSRTCSVCGKIESAIEPMLGGITVTVTDADGKVVKVETISGDLKEITLNGIADGEYTVTLTKKNYVSRNYNVSVSDGEAVIETKLQLIGDVTGDDKVNTIDVARANAHAKGVSPVSGYIFECADVTGDGRVNTIDVSRINAHVKGVSPLW